MYNGKIEGNMMSIHTNDDVVIYRYTYKSLRGWVKVLARGQCFYAPKLQQRTQHKYTHKYEHHEWELSQSSFAVTGLV